MMEQKALLAAAVIATAGGVIPAVSGTLTKPRDTPSRGHFCGRDNGKDAMRKQPRNQLCVCGSGRKAKRCCVYEYKPGEVRPKPDESQTM